MKALECQGKLPLRQLRPLPTVTLVREVRHRPTDLWRSGVRRVRDRPTDPRGGVRHLGRRLGKTAERWLVGPPAISPQHPSIPDARPPAVILKSSSSFRMSASPSTSPSKRREMDVMKL